MITRPVSHVSGASTVVTRKAIEPRVGSQHRLQSVASVACIALIGLTGAYTLFRPWNLHWGANYEEIKMALPGDELVSHASNVGNSTRAITIQASVADVWPWLVQMGQGRGGLYSYDFLENLAGCEIHSVDQVMPELQTLSVGDKIRIYKEGGGPPPFTVVSIDPGTSLVLGILDANSGLQNPHWVASWAFVLNKIDDGHTRLIVRSRGEGYTGDFAVEPLQFIMERQMLYGIKDRAESLAFTHD